MKKILTILAATATALAFGAAPESQGETINHGADFEAEGFVPGANFIWGYNDSYTDATGEDRYWFTLDTDAANIISNYTATPATTVPIASRPDKFADDLNSKYLQVETTGKLYRTVKGNGGSGDFTNSTTYAYSIANAPIYLDTLVKFTAADSVFGDDALENGDKIAIEYVEHESEGPGDDTVTNFVIRAGYFAQTVIATNYFAAVPADFDKDAWHRLTVRTFASIDAANHVGFVVYLDGTPLEYEDTVLAGDNFTATGAAANFYKEGCHALYPSFVQGGDFQYSISAAAFSGNGSLDDVVFTTTTPNFITAGESVRTEITLGTGIANVAVTVAGTPIAAESTSTSTLKIFNLPAGTTSFVLSVSANEAEGYTFDETTGITLTDATYSAADDTVTITGTSPALTVTATRNNFSLFDDNGDSLGACETLKDALTAANVATIKLAYDYTVADWETVPPSGPIYTIADGTEIVLDLNGKTLNGGSREDDEFFYVVGAMTVIDSVGGGKIVYGGCGIFAVEGDLAIGAVTDDNGPFIDGVLYADGSGDLIRAKVSTAGNTDAGVLTWSVAPGSACAAEPVDGYWVVTPQPIGTYQVTIVPTNNTTYAVAGATSNVGDVYTVATGNSITITVTPDSNYEYAVVPDGWSAGQDGKITKVISATGTVEIPGPTVQTLGTYTVTVIPTNNTTYAAAYKVGGSAITPDNDVLTVTVGQTIVITATPNSGYEYAEAPTGWTLSEGVITIEVSEAGTVAIPAPTATGGKTYPSYITDATAQGKYDAWATANNISATDFPDTGNAYQDAYLLNCAPDAAVVAAEKAAFKFTSISYDTTQSKWVTTTTVKNTSDADYNGTVVVKQYSDVGCTTESSTGTFFKAFLQ